MPTTNNTEPRLESDPIDALVPAPRPTWARLAIGIAITALVGTVAFLWGFGFLFPQPGCCGTGGSSAVLALTEDGRAVTITASLYNSSGRDLTIDSATADLPGADVLGITLVDRDNYSYPTRNVSPLPAGAPARDLSRLLITFVPTTCEDTTDTWGSVTVDLSVADSPFPSFGRTYELPDPVFGSAGNLAVFAPESLQETSLPQRPLAAACALLGR